MNHPSRSPCKSFFVLYSRPRVAIFVRSLGFNEDQIRAMEEPVLHFATAVGAELPEAAALAGATLRIFGLEARDSEDVLAGLALGNAIFLAYNQHTGRLMNERKISVTGGEMPHLTFEHPIYERFLDLKKQNKRDRRIHNRFVFGTVYSIARRLTLGILDEAADMLRVLNVNADSQ